MSSRTVIFRLGLIIHHCTGTGRKCSFVLQQLIISTDCHGIFQYRITALFIVMTFNVVVMIVMVMMMMTVAMAKKRLFGFQYCKTDCRHGLLTIVCRTSRKVTDFS